MSVQSFLINNGERNPNEFIAKIGRSLTIPPNSEICVNKLNEIPTEKYTECEYIIVDEGQFFEDLYDFVTTATDLNNKHVIVVGLNGDSNRANFGDIHRLYPFADKINLLTAMCITCKDGTPGIFSKKISNDTNQTDIGSTDKYIPVCRKCFNK